MPRPLLELRGCRVDLDRGVVLAADGEAALTTREAELLAYLADRPLRAVSRDELHDALWGIGRRVVTRALDNTVQRLRAKIEDNPTLPHHLLTVYGEGYKFVPLDRPIAKTARLPPEIDRFVGRAAELATVDGLLAVPGVVAIVGPAGAGKTRTAIRVASAWRAPMVFVELAAVRDADGVWQAIGAAIGAPDGRAATLREVIAAFLAERAGALVVLDNVEQLVAAMPEVCDGLCEASPEARVLLTSRQAPGTRGERTLALGPLPTADAVALLLDRAGPAPEAPAAVVASIVHRLDGLPLAIELAARRLAVVSPERLLVHLDDRFALLASAAARVRALAGEPERGVLWQTLEWSWELLDPELRDLLAVACVFPASFQAEDLAAVAGLGVATTVDRLDGLVRRHLARVATEDRRVALYEGVRAHARTKGTAAEAAWIAHFAAQARVWLAACEGPDGPDVRRRLAAERENLVAAAERARPPHVVALALACDPLVSGHGTRESWLRLLDRALAVDPDPELWRARGEACRLLGDATGAEAAFRRAIDEGPALLRAIARTALGNLWRQVGRHAEAEAELLAAISELTPLGEQPWHGTALGYLGTVLAILGRPDEAVARFEEAIAALAGYPRHRANAAGNLGVLHLFGRRFAEALASFGDAIAIHEAWGDRRSLGNCTMNRGGLYLEIGELDAAEAGLDAALALAREVADRRLEATARLNLGLLALDRRRDAEAEGLLRDATRRLEALRDPVATLAARSKLGIARLLRGFPDDARSDLERAAALGEAAHQSDFVELQRAWIAVSRGEVPDAPVGTDPILRTAILVLRRQIVSPAIAAHSLDVRLASRWAG